MRPLSRYRTSGCGVGALAAVTAIIASSACGNGACADASPNVQCAPLPAGSPGCLGTPSMRKISFDAGIDAKVYPANCEAIVTVVDTCTSEAWVCQKRNQDFEWEPPGI